MDSLIAVLVVDTAVDSALAILRRTDTVVNIVAVTLRFVARLTVVDADKEAMLILTTFLRVTDNVLIDAVNALVNCCACSLN